MITMIVRLSYQQFNYTLSTFASGLVPPTHNIIERFPNLRGVIAADIKDILLKNRNIKT